jgi:hypothetical protein
MHRRTTSIIVLRARGFLISWSFSLMVSSASLTIVKSKVISLRGDEKGGGLKKNEGWGDTSLHCITVPCLYTRRPAWKAYRNNNKHNKRSSATPRSSVYFLGMSHSTCIGYRGLKTLLKSGGSLAREARSRPCSFLYHLPHPPHPKTPCPPPTTFAYTA